MVLSPIVSVGLSDHFSFLLLLMVKLSFKLETTYKGQFAQSHRNRDHYLYSCHAIVGWAFNCSEYIPVWFLLSEFLFLYLHLKSVVLFVCVWSAPGSLWKYVLRINSLYNLIQQRKARKILNFPHNFVLFGSNQQASGFYVTHQPSNLHMPPYITP